MIPFEIERLGVLMEPKPGDPNESGGVLNPAAARGKDGQLYLFPRVVGPGNYSRIGIVRVLFDSAGEPTGVERLGYALEPEADYERDPKTGRGGCEDARVTFVEVVDHYVMTYTALTASGPRIAIARSEDLITWERVGLAKFHRYKDMDFNGVDDKDASVCPALVDDPDSEPSVAMLHRPLFRGTRPEELANTSGPEDIENDLQTIWISYWHWDRETMKRKSRQFVAMRRLAMPDAPWERLKIGGGPPPIECRHGWLFLYHGVSEREGSTAEHPKLCYSAGAMILDRERPHRILYRSPEPILIPTMPQELTGTVDGVVFPTGLDRRSDIGQPDRYDVYFGMADDRIGVGKLIVPETLPKQRHHRPSTHEKGADHEARA